MRVVILLAAMASCSPLPAYEPPAQEPDGSFRYNDASQNANHRTQSLCMDYERAITQHEFAASAGTQTVAGSRSRHSAYGRYLI